MKLHQKGYLLVELSQAASLWDDTLITLALQEYGLAGDYWEKNLRVALDELAAAGLIRRIEEKLKNVKGRPTLMFRYQLSDFGRTRMLDTGLLTQGDRK
jgi:DNA-binding transcriptional regulator PaaX